MLHNGRFQALCARPIDYFQPVPGNQPSKMNRSFQKANNINAIIRPNPTRNAIS